MGFALPFDKGQEVGAGGGEVCWTVSCSFSEVDDVQVSS
jgi:hypothetical protein